MDPSTPPQWVNSVITANWTNPSKPVPNGHTSSSKETADGFASFYEALFQPKIPDAAANRLAMAALLAGDKVLPPTAAMCAAPICPEEATKICLNLPTGKSPGPDRLPNKLYVVLAGILGPILSEVFNYARDHGSLPSEMLEGTISVLYKKKKRDDPRNYRPITLLNSDYKVLMRALTARMNEAVVQFVSPSQNGFVPNSFIAENSMLLKLIQAYVEDEDLEAMYLFADM